MLTSFNTSYIDQYGDIIKNRKLIMKNYLKTWFLIDLISNFPINEIITIIG
jgi:hypothetical protein